MNKIVRRFPKRRCLAKLLSDPFVGRRARDSDMDNTPRSELGDEEGEQRSEEDVGDLEKVAGPDVFGMVLQEGCPGLTMRTRWTYLPDVPLNRPLCDL